MVVISWIIFYLFASFFPKLLWGYCDNSFNSNSKYLCGDKACNIFVCFYSDCYSSIEDSKCKTDNKNDDEDKIFYMKTCMSVKDICKDYGLQGLNASYCFNKEDDIQVPIRDKIKRVLASEEYY